METAMPRVSPDAGKSVEQTSASAEEQRRQEQKATVVQRMSRIKRKVIVLSGKGGVGKSTVAVNLAVAAAATGSRVGLLDVDVHGPSVPKLLGIEGARPGVRQGTIEPIEVADNLRVMSVGLLIPDRNDAVIWRGPMKHAVIRQLLADVEWGDLDLLLVDSPPGTGDEPLSVIQLIGDADGSIVVTTPQELAVNDVRRSVTFSRQLSVPVLGIMENMSGFACPKCGEVSNLFGSGGGQALATEMNVPFLGTIPIEPQISSCGDAGIPYVDLAEDSPATRVFRAALAAVTGE
jgi:ATP-binding protein involved in chromosome partitioning